jgi:hypothetical protein
MLRSPFQVAVVSLPLSLRQRHCFWLTIAEASTSLTRQLKKKKSKSFFIKFGFKNY